MEPYTRKRCRPGQEVSIQKKKETNKGKRDQKLPAKRAKGAAARGGGKKGEKGFWEDLLCRSSCRTGDIKRKKEEGSQKKKNEKQGGHEKSV